MKTRFLQLAEDLRASYWFIPGLMTLGAIALAVSTEVIDRWLTPDLVATLGIVYQGGPEGARALLTTVAGSMITVAGVAFSITMVALVLASSQFGPRILRNFMRDRGNQFVLGTFIATFLYCLLVLRTVQSLDQQTFVPHISITFALLLALASVAVLIYFIDHIADSIQAPNVVARVGADVDRAVDKIFQEPEKAEEAEEAKKASETEAAKKARESGATTEATEATEGEKEGEDAEEAADTKKGTAENSDDDNARSAARGAPSRRTRTGGWMEQVGGKEAEAEEEGRSITGDKSGYVQLINESGLIEAAKDADVVISCLQRQGGFAVEGGPLAQVSPPENVDEELEKKVRGAFLYGRTRTDIQDVDFAVKQLVEIAVRALSPGINDPFTAMNCVDQLTASLARAGRLVPADPRLLDDEGTTRVILPRPAFPDLLDAAFDPIREHGSSTTAVLARILSAIISLDAVVERTEGRIALLRHADQVSETAAEGLTDQAGLRRIEALHRLVRRRLEDVAEDEEEEDEEKDEEKDREEREEVEAEEDAETGE